MDKFNNSNSSLALQKFYNQQNNVKLFELQQRLKTEQTLRLKSQSENPVVCQIEMSKLINEEKVINEEQVINEEKVIIEEQVINEEKVIIEESNQQEPLNGESLGEIYYQSNENFEI